MASPSSPRSEVRSRPLVRGLLLLLKAALAVGVMSLVLRRVSVADLWNRLAALSLRGVALLVILSLAQVSVGVVRWWRVLAGVGHRVPLRRLYADVMLGLLYNVILPTSVGGDVVRALRCRKRVGASAWSTVLYERVAGFVALAMTGALAALLLLNGEVDAALLPPALRWGALALTVLLGAAFLGAAAPFRWIVRLLSGRMSAGAVTDLRRIEEDLSGPLARTSVRLEVLAWSFALQGSGILFAIASAEALGAPGHAQAIAMGLPLILMLTLLPLTPGGHGLREGLFVGILGALGVPSDAALGIGALWLASSLAFAACGAVVSAVPERAQDATAVSVESTKGAPGSAL